MAGIREFLDDAYGARLRLTGRGSDRPLMCHERVAIGPVTIDDVSLPGALEASPDPLDRILVVWPNSGRVSATCAGMSSHAGPDEITVMSQPDLPHRAQSEDAHATAVMLDPGLVAREAGSTSSVDPHLVRFSSLGPVDDAAARLWKNTVRYVRDCVLADDEVATPLVLGQCSRLLAAVSLATFPNQIAAEPATHDRTDSRPALLRQAIAYIEANADCDIGVCDIADAVHVTPRAVQYMFRRHLDTTPLQYLRRVRLDYAHRDLVDGDPVRHTVIQIAARWGFGHTGRFATLYRQTFGCSPHETLRRDSAARYRAELSS